MNVAHCDFEGMCRNKAFREVYPRLLGNKGAGWSYLCRRHFYEEQKRLGKRGKKLPWAGFKKIDRIRNGKKKKG